MDADDLAERLHERLDRMLKRAGVENRVVARRVGVAAETVSRWRNGRQGIADAELELIVELLREHGVTVTMGWLRYGDSPKIPGQTSSADIPRDPPDEVAHGPRDKRRRPKLA